MKVRKHTLLNWSSALVISEISDVTKLDSLNRESYKFI